MNHKKFLAATVQATLLLLPVFASAQTISGMAATLANQVVTVGYVLVIIMWVVTGILYLTSMGDPGKLKTANLSLFAAIGGTALVIIAQGAVGFVTVNFGA